MIQPFQKTGIYPILDYDYCLKKDIPMESLIDLWSSFSDYILFYQFRAKSLSEKEFAKQYHTLKKKSSKLKIILNDFWKFAIEEKAFGFHLGKEDFESLNPDEKESIQGSSLFKGTSSHSLSDLKNLRNLNWDYTGIGPIFSTETKISPHPTLGLNVLKEIENFTNIGISPIGGISELNLDSILKIGNFFPASVSAFSDEKRFLKCISILEKNLVR